MNEMLFGDNVEIMQKFPDNFIDLVVTSPPYDNLRSYHGNGIFNFERTAKELKRILKNGGVIVWIVSDATVRGTETGTSFKQALYFKEIGLNLHDTMIWNKPGFTDVGSLKVRYAPVFEYMFILSKGKPKTFNPLKDRKTLNPGTVNIPVNRKSDGTFKKTGKIRKTLEFGQRYNVWKMNPVNNKENTGHPAQFPIELVKDHILSWSNEGDIILDPFSGSGTTAIACLFSNRKYICIEKNKEYYENSLERIKLYTKQNKKENTLGLKGKSIIWAV